MEKIWDLLAFLAVLLAPSMAVIMYFLFYRPIQACQDFMYGKYAVHWTCVGASLAGLCLGPMTLLWPLEFIRTGTTWLIGMVIGFLIAALLVSIVHIPVLHYNRSCSIYQYLEDRFRSKFLRYGTFAFNLLSGLLFCIGILILSSELAERSLRTTIVGDYVKRWVCILVLATLTGTASTVGGQKAAIFLGSFTLFFEFIIALICAVAMGVYRYRTSSFYVTGIVVDDERDNKTRFNHTNTMMDELDGDRFSSSLTPEYRLTTSTTNDTRTIVDQQNIWLTSSVCVLYFFYVLGCQQSAHQHYCSVATKKRARLVLLATILTFLIVWTLTFILICLIINFYTDPSRLVRNCFFESISSSTSFRLLFDPYTSLKIFFDVSWPNIEGASGYFFACFTCVCVFSCLPTTFVSLASSCYEDLIKPYYYINAEESRQIFVLKILTIIFASISTIGALLLSELLLTTAAAADGSGDGQFWWLYVKNICLTLATWTMPFAGLYVLAIWLPFTNAKGALAGVWLGFALTLTLCFLHLTRFSFDSHIQKPNSLLYKCCQGRILMDNGISMTTTNHSNEYGIDLMAKNSSLFNMDPISASDRNRISCFGYDLLQNSNIQKNTVNLGYRLTLPLQAIIIFFATISIGICVSLVSGRQDIYALDWNLVYWTCNRLDSFRFRDCFARGNAASSFDGHTSTGGSKPYTIPDLGGGKKKKRQRGPYTTSESFRYSKQGPFPDTSYLNPKVQDYMATLTRTNT